MAESGGTNRPQPPSGVSKDTRRLGSAMAMAVGLNTLQAQEARRQEQQEPRRSDNRSLTERDQRSPLDLPQKSYAEAMDFEEQRTREAEMVETAEQFVGTPTVPGRDASSSPQENEDGPNQPTSRRQGRTSNESEEQATEAEQVQELALQQAQAQQQEEAAREALHETAEREAKDTRQKGLQRIWGFVVGANRAMSAAIVPGIFAEGLANIQLLNSLTAKNELIPNQTLPGKATTVFNDCLCCALCLPALISGTVIFIVVAASIYQIIEVLDFF